MACGLWGRGGATPPRVTRLSPTQFFLVDFELPSNASTVFRLMLLPRLRPLHRQLVDLTPLGAEAAASV